MTRKMAYARLTGFEISRDRMSFTLPYKTPGLLDKRPWRDMACLLEQTTVESLAWIGYAMVANLSGKCSKRLGELRDRRKGIMTVTSQQINQLQDHIITSMRDTQKHKVWSRLEQLIRTYKFEMKGRSNVVALAPKFITLANYQEAAAATVHIHTALQTLLNVFKKEHRQGPLHDYFKPYERFYDLVHSEVRSLDDILLMRADYSAISDVAKRKAFEPNSACPGSFADYPVINNAFEAFVVEEGWLKPDAVYRPPLAKEQAFFGRTLVKLAKRFAPNRPPNVLLGNYHGTYTSELDGLMLLFASLPKSDQDGGKLLCGDVGELQEEGGYFYFRGEPISLVFNKLDPLMVSEDKADLAVWLSAARSPNIEFLNSFGAMFLTETKRSFGAIADPDIQALLGLPEDVVAAIETYVPETIPLHFASAAKMRDIERNKDAWVLKPDALTRGDGVKFGIEMSANEWKATLAAADAEGSVLQRTANTERQSNIIYDAHARIFKTVECFHGMDIFVIDGEAVGYSSRCRDNRVINVGAGGYAAPLVILK